MSYEPKKPKGTTWSLGHSADDEPAWKSIVWVLLPVVVAAAIVAFAW